MGVDPDDSIRQNRWLHEHRQCRLEDLDTNRRFDLISLRMVAEHIADPTAAVAALGRLTRENGRVVIYTVSKWAPASLVAAATPLSVHHAVKRVLWGTSPKDTFPTVFRMNTRRRLNQLFRPYGFVEEQFLHLNDCRAFGGWKVGALVELSCERVLRALGLPYPEICILGVYRKDYDASPG